MSDLLNGVRALIDAYTGALDMRELDSWLALFSEDGYYACLRWVEDQQGNNVVLIGEDMKRLRARVQAGASQDRRRMVHATSAVRVSPQGDAASAVFALWYDGLATYAGRYRLELKREGPRLLIRRCTVILDNEIITTPIYMPI